MDRVELGYSQGRVELSQGKVEGSHIGCSCHLSQKVYICWWEQKMVQSKGTNYGYKLPNWGNSLSSVSAFALNATASAYFCNSSTEGTLPVDR